MTLSELTDLVSELEPEARVQKLSRPHFSGGLVFELGSSTTTIDEVAEVLFEAADLVFENELYPRGLDTKVKAGGSEIVGLDNIVKGLYMIETR